jgi:glycosyltransferase involved in cell wall biosynthesis
MSRLEPLAGAPPLGNTAHTGARLRVAVVAPPWYEVPPMAYGGREAICSVLAGGLVARGYQVTLVAAGRDLTSAHMLRTFDHPPSNRLGQALPEVLHAAKADRALADLDLDVVHDHSLAGPLLAAGRTMPTVVTTHSPMNGEVGAYYKAISPHVSLVAISWTQRRDAPMLPWVATVHNGLPIETYPFRANKEHFALFLGRMSPQKGTHLAIDAARAAGLPLVIAAKCIEPAEHAYFAQAVRPRLGPDITMVGEAEDAQKRDLLARAACLLFPIRWSEPFGLVMVEALACGTPVVALAGGAVSEIVEHGVSGYVGSDPQALPGLLRQLDRIDPVACRRQAYRFDAAAMVTGYEAVYREAISHRQR